MYLSRPRHIIMNHKLRVRNVVHKDVRVTIRNNNTVLHKGKKILRGRRNTYRIKVHYKKYLQRRSATKM